MNWGKIPYKIRRIKPIRTIRAIIDGIVNVFKWLPIVWRDRDWDYGYFDEMILFKLKQMEKYFRSEPHIIEDWEKVADEIKETIDTFQRSIDDNYAEELGYVYEPFKFESIEGSGLSRLVSNKTEEEKRKDYEIIKKAMQMQSRDRRRAFVLMARHSRGWWD